MKRLFFYCFLFLFLGALTAKAPVSKVIMPAKLPLPTSASGPNVAFDVAFEKGSGSATSPFSYVSNAGTVSGSIGANANRVLIAYCVFRTITPSAVAITWNSVSMTQITTVANGSYTLYIFGLIAPSTGAQTISCSWSGGGPTAFVLGAVSAYNVNQTTAWQNSGNDSGTGTSASSSVTTAAGNMVVVAHQNDNATGTTPNAGTSAWTETSLNGNYAMSYKASSTTPETVSWTLGSSVAWTHVKTDLIKN